MVFVVFAVFDRLRLNNLLSKDDRAVGEIISAGVMVSVLKRKDDGVPGRLVCEELVRRDDEPVRMCRGGGLRDEGIGA